MEDDEKQKEMKVGSRIAWVFGIRQVTEKEMAYAVILCEEGATKIMLQKLCVSLSRKAYLKYNYF